jgi:hypothetical protein
MKTLSNIVVGTAIFILGAFVGGMILASTEKAGTAAVVKTIDSLQQQMYEQTVRAQKCEAQFTNLTVLYEFDATPGLPILGGALSIQPGSAANPVGQVRPKWIVPAKIIPTILPGVQGASFSYFDPQTRKLDGPYVPKASTP